MVFGVRLPRALSSTFIRQALRGSDGIPGLSAAMRGLVAARAAVRAAVVAIDGDIRKMARASGACRRLMSIPGVGQLTDSPSQPQLTIPVASGDLVISAPISVWCRGAISQVRSTTPAASQNAAIGGCGHFSTKPRMSC